MNTTSCLGLVLLDVGLASSTHGAGEYITSAASTAELEALYTTAIQGRADEILDALSLEDEAKVSEVRDVIMNQYRALRARDAVVDGYFRTVLQEGSEAEKAKLVGRLNAPLHELYIGTLSALLTLTKERSGV